MANAERIGSAPRRSRGLASRGAGFLERLGIVGYRSLEPVLLAALALEAPVLLVGPHGTAKSLLVERLAGALGLSFRHYNASLLNYDDLVGIPLPAADGASLRFVGTPGAVWGAGFVFFDEISRCRPDLQNKLFPVIHERRVAGVDLPDLRHRFAAMNPPAPEEGDAGGLDPVYLGSEALDPALADRFAFVIRVPSWRELSAPERLRVVSGAEPLPPAADRGKRQPPELAVLVARCAAQLREVPICEQIADYVVHLVGLLAKAEIPASPRRARMLARNVAAVHAARLVLVGDDAELEASAEVALAHGLPQTADVVPASRATLVAAHRQAWEVARLARGDTRREVFAESDPARRVAMGEKLADPDLARLVTSALSEEPCDARRMGLATAMFLGLRERRQLSPAAWEMLAQLARRVLEPRDRKEQIDPGPDRETWREIDAALAADKDADRISDVERNFLYAGFPNLWRGVRWRRALARFREDLALFGVDTAA